MNKNNPTPFLDDVPASLQGVLCSHVARERLRDVLLTAGGHVDTPASALLTVTHDLLAGELVILFTQLVDHKDSDPVFAWSEIKLGICVWPFASPQALPFKTRVESLGASARPPKKAVGLDPGVDPKWFAEMMGIDLSLTTLEQLLGINPHKEGDQGFTFIPKEDEEDDEEKDNPDEGLQKL